MRKLVLCEGKQDNILLDSILTFLGIPKGIGGYNLFNQEAYATLPCKKRSESEYLNHFLGKESPYVVGGKSEGGRNALIEIFIHTFIYFISSKVEPLILVDFDEGQLDMGSLVSEIENSVKRRITNKIDSLRLDSSSDSTKFKIARVSVILKGGRSYSFRIIAFKQSLETEAGITDSDDMPTKITKIKYFFDSNRSEMMDVFGFIRSECNT